MSESCEGYTNALALVDVIPIVAFGFAFWFLLDVFRGQDRVLQVAVRVAAVLLVAGAALAGPGRKLVIANQDGCDLHEELQLPFFIPMPMAFLLLSWAAVSLWKGRRVSVIPFAAVLAVIWAAAALAQDRVVCLAGAGLVAVFLAVVLALVARERGDLVASGLYVLYALGTLALPALGSSDERSDSSHQWLEQGTNSVTFVVFALACYRLRGATQRSGDSSVLVER